MKKAITTTAILLGLSSMVGASTAGPQQSHQKPSLDETTKAIRKTAYEMMKAFLTQDVNSFKRHSAKRTLELVSLAYEAARQDPRYQQELQTARITNADEFLGYFMLGLATQYLQAAPLSLEAAARRVANDSKVSFLSATEASIIVGSSEFAKARLVARAWKIDLTDSLKKAVLKEVNNPELRARIERL